MATTTPKTKHSFQYWQWRVILSTMVGYSVYYFVRKNFSFAMPALGDEYGISNTSFGIILTLVGLIYGVSKCVNGVLSDRTNARWHLSFGLAVCVLLNVAFGWSDKLSAMITGHADGPDFVNGMVAVMAVLLVLNNIFQGSGFPPCARLLTHWIPPHELATKMSIWNTSHSIGASVLAILCGYVMGTMGSDLTGNAEAVEAIRTNLTTLNPALLDNPAELEAQVASAAAHVGAWQWCFWVPALFALAGAVGLAVFLRDTPRSVGLPEMEGTHTKVEDNTNSAEYKAFLREKVFRNPLIWILAFANFFVYVVRFAVLDWGPKFLQEARGMDPADAGWIIAVSEIMGIVGMLVAGWATDKFFRGRAHRTCVICMLGAAAFMAMFYFLPSTSPVVVLAGVLGMVGFFIYGPQALIGIAAANQATKSAAATANGVTGIFGYLSTFVSGLGIGAMVDWVNKVNPGQGWNYVFLMMIAMAVVGMLIFMLMWRAKATGYDTDEQQA